MAADMASRGLGSCRRRHILGAHRRLTFPLLPRHCSHRGSPWRQRPACFDVGGDGPRWSGLEVVVGALDRAVGTGFSVDPGRVEIAGVGMEDVVEG